MGAAQSTPFRTESVGNFYLCTIYLIILLEISQDPVSNIDTVFHTKRFRFLRTAAANFLFKDIFSSLLYPNFTSDFTTEKQWLLNLVVLLLYREDSHAHTDQTI